MYTLFLTMNSLLTCHTQNDFHFINRKAGDFLFDKYEVTLNDKIN